MSTTTTTTTTARRTGVHGLVLVTAAFLLTTGINLLAQVGDILFNDADPHRAEGPIESIQGIALIGGIALVLALAVAIPCAGDASRSRVGAVVLGVLAILSLVAWWSGAPATIGAAAAWLAGFGRGAATQTGVPRGFGVVGLVLAVLTIVVTVVGITTASVQNWG
jgi:hypothetical protein